MSPLRIPAFRNLLLAQAISQMGDSFYFVIFTFMVQRITGSPAVVGFVSALEMLPYVVLGGYAGVIADRMDRRKIMLASDLASAGILLCFATLIFLDAKPPVWTLALTATSLSMSRVFFMPARGAAIPALVPEDLLLKANSISAATQNVMPMISLSLSAGVLAILYKISPTWFFLSSILLNLLSFLGSALYVAKVPPVIPDRTAVQDARPMQDLVEGIRYVRGRHDLWLMLGLQLLLNLTISPFFVVYLSANKKWFGDQPQTLAWMEFSFFFGMVVSSMLVGKFRITRPGLAYAFSTAAVGLCVAMMGFTPVFTLFILWNVLAGLAIPFGNVPVNTYMQMTVPDAFRGRVNSAWTMASVGSQPIGLSLGGLIVQAFGIQGGFWTMGGGMTLSGLIGLFDRQFRTMKMPVPPPAELIPLAAPTTTPGSGT